MFHALISGTGAMVSEFMMKDHWNLYTIVKKGYIKEVSSFFVQEDREALQEENDVNAAKVGLVWLRMVD